MTEVCHQSSFEGCSLMLNFRFTKHRHNPKIIALDSNISPIKFVTLQNKRVHFNCRFSFLLISRARWNSHFLLFHMVCISQFQQSEPFRFAKSQFLLFLNDCEDATALFYLHRNNSYLGLQHSPPLQ